MKCTKCGFISFDYEQFCPKCNKDLTAVKEKMNLPSYRPAPLSLLGALIGESEKLDTGLGIEGLEGNLAVGQDVAISTEDLQAVEVVEEADKDSQDFEIIFKEAPEEPPEEAAESFDLPASAQETVESKAQEEKPSLDFAPKDVAEELSLDLEDLTFEGPETGSPQAEEATEHELIFEPDLPPTERADIDKTAVFESTEIEEEKFSFDLEDLSLEEPEAGTEQEMLMEREEGSRIDLEKLASMVEDLTGAEGAEDQASPPGEDLPSGEDFSIDNEIFELDLELDKTDDEST